MTEKAQNNQVSPQNAQFEAQKKEEVNSKTHQHLSTIFVVVGIVSFTLGAIVNWYTIKRIRGGKP
jgi:hypothetical protein